MELSLHPIKRAKRAFLTEEGPHLESLPSMEDKLMSFIQKEHDASFKESSKTLPAENHRSDVVQATAELNQWMNALDLVRGKEYLKLLPIRRESIGVKSTPLHDAQKVALVQQRLQGAADILAKGEKQAQHVVDRRRLFSRRLQNLQPHWVFSTATDPNTRHTSIAIDCSFARFTRRPLANFTRQPLDHLIPLEIASEGDEPISIPSSVSRKEYLNIRLQVIDSISLDPLVSTNSIDICRHEFDDNSIEYFAFLNHHSHLSQQVFQFLTQGMKQTFHKVALSLPFDLRNTSPNCRSYDTFLESFICTAKEKSRLILEISLNYSLLIELTPFQEDASSDALGIAASSLSPYLKGPCDSILRSVFLSVVNQIPTQDPPVSLNAAEKYRKAFSEAKDSLSTGDAYFNLVRNVVRVSRIALCLAHTEVILDELAYPKVSVERPYLLSESWNQPIDADESFIEAMVIKHSNDRLVLETDGSVVRVTHLSQEKVVGRYAVRDTRGLAEVIRSKLCS